MTTPLIPVYSVLTETTYTPRTLIQDQAVDDWLTTNSATTRRRIQFITSLMTAYRLGQQSFTHQFDSPSDAQYIKTLLETPEQSGGYGYAVTLVSPDTVSVVLTT